MPKAASKRSALYFFADEYRRKTGSYNMSIRSAIDLCHREYKELDPAEKARYEQMYKAWKDETRKANPGLNSVGETIGQTVDSVSYAIGRQDVHREVCEDLIKRKLNDGSEDIDFYVVSVQTFCKTLDNHYLCAEFAISKVGKGHATEHESHVVNPGSIPLGCSADCRESEERHRITSDLSQLAQIEGVRTYSQMWIHLRTILGRRMRKGKQPSFQTADDIIKNAENVLFTLDANVEIVKDLLTQFAEAAGETCWFAVCSAEALINTMYRNLYERKKTCSLVAFDTKPENFTTAYATRKLTFDHVFHSFCCKFHDMHVTEHCALIHTRIAAKVLSQYYIELFEEQ